MPRFLVIGHGIAGIMVSTSLMQRNLPFKILGKKNTVSATSKASGIINPLTGRVLAKSWMIEELLDAADKHYPFLENIIGQQVYTTIDIWRKISTDFDFSMFNQRKDQADYQSFLDNDIYSDLPDGIRPCKYGFMKIRAGRLIDAEKLYHGFFKHANENDLILEGSMNDLEHDNSHYKLSGERFDHVILCDGAHGAVNTHSNYLNFALVKGEALIIRLPIDLPKAIYNIGGLSLSPFSDNRWYAGSTFQWDYTDDQPSDKFKEVIIGKLNTGLKLDYKIDDHIAGIRPASKDRRPFVGKVGNHSSMFVLNGLGTKGMSLAPYFANALIDHIMNGTSLPDEVYPERKTKT